MIPEARKASFFTPAYDTTRFVLGVRLAAAPPQFRESVSSGVNTSRLNSNIIVQVHFDVAPPTLQRVDFFLQSDQNFYMSPESKEIQIKL